VDVLMPQERLQWSQCITFLGGFLPKSLLLLLSSFRIYFFMPLSSPKFRPMPASASRTVPGLCDVFSLTTVQVAIMYTLHGPFRVCSHVSPPKRRLWLGCRTHVSDIGFFFRRVFRSTFQGREYPFWATNR
jgi:hypothetical protein